MSPDAAPAADWTSLYRSIQRCSAVYEPDAVRATEAFEQLGSVVLGRYCDSGHQAIAHRTAARRATLTISGTRVTEGTWAEHFVDLGEDACCLSEDVGDGVCVHAGAVAGLGQVWRWAAALFAADSPIDVEGHSLGGQRTCLTPLFLPPGRIGRLTAWEPPRAANAAFWTRFTRSLWGLTTVVHGRDPWADWPWLTADLTHGPWQLLWLRDGGWEWTKTWRAGGIEHWRDHGPDTVLAAVAALAGETVAAAA